MKHSLERSLNLTINGDRVHIQDRSPTLTLLEYLRQSGRIGTKEGCGDGDCGACTIVVIGNGADGEPHFQAVNSCLIPIGALAGREILTVEGVSTEQLHPVQAAMVQSGGSQCGYCTPGFIMSLFAAYYDRALDDRAVEGNLCRCTGYLPIRRATQFVNQSIVEKAPCDRFSEQLIQATTALEAVNYCSQDHTFYRPLRLQTVLELLQQHPEAKLIAGATDLGLEFSHHRQSFPVLISLETVAELHQIQQSFDSVEIGAAVPLSQIEANLRGVFRVSMKC